MNNKKFFNLTVDETKELLKKLQKDLKEVQKGNMRNVFVGPYVLLDLRYEFLMAQYDNYHRLAYKERQRANTWLMDRDTLAKTGIFDENVKKFSKETEENIKVWTEMAYPKIDEQVWDILFEQEALITYLRSF